MNRKQLFLSSMMMALVLLGSQNRTIQLALPLLKQLRHADYGALAAGVILTIVPIYVMFVLFQEQITSGLTRGAVKG